MEARIETITIDDELPIVRVTLAVVYRSTHWARRPKEDDYIQQWMNGEGNEQNLAEQRRIQCSR